MPKQTVKARIAEWFVEGEPRPQGSKDALGREASKYVKSWREAVHYTAPKAMRFDGPVVVQLGFYLRRPRKDFKDGMLRSTAPIWCTKKPDIDKLQRAVLDALTTAKTIVDDSYVVQIHAQKMWADDDIPGVKVQVQELNQKHESV